MEAERKKGGKREGRNRKWRLIGGKKEKEEEEKMKAEKRKEGGREN